MATIYQDEQPRAADGNAAGLVAGLVLVLAVIALVFLVTRAAPNAVNNAIESVTPGSNSDAAGANGLDTSTPTGSPDATVQ